MHCLTFCSLQKKVLPWPIYIHSWKATNNSPKSYQKHRSLLQTSDLQNKQIMGKNTLRPTLKQLLVAHLVQQSQQQCLLMFLTIPAFLHFSRKLNWQMISVSQAVSTLIVLVTQGYWLFWKLRGLLSCRRWQCPATLSKTTAVSSLYFACSDSWQAEKKEKRQESGDNKQQVAWILFFKRRCSRDGETYTSNRFLSGKVTELSDFVLVDNFKL